MRFCLFLYACFLAHLYGVLSTTETDWIPKDNYNSSIKHNNPDGLKKGRILFYLPSIGASMEMTLAPLVTELAHRGHQLVLVAQDYRFSHVEPGIWERKIELWCPITGRNELISDNFELFGVFHFIYFALQRVFYDSMECNDRALGHPDLKEEIQKGFDIVVVSPLTWSEAGYYLAERTNAALILWQNEQVSHSPIDWALGQPHNPAYLPFCGFDFDLPLNFFQRFIGTVGSSLFHGIVRYLSLPTQEKLLDKHFPGEDRPALTEIEKNISMVFQSSHFLLTSGMRPTLPIYQHTLMIHCTKPKQLPQEIQDYMDNSKNGVVYVSFGTVVQPTTMENDIHDAIINALGSLDYDVLMVHGGGRPLGNHKNVRYAKWLPQQDLLGHPKTRLFVTHGGHAGFQEALCHAVPVVAIPFFWDQVNNAVEVERIGFGKVLKYHDVTSKALHEAITEVMRKNIYTKKAKEYQDILLNDQNGPGEKAIWWFEFFIRHPEHRHLKKAAHQLNWYQYFLLDVILFLTIVLAIFSYSFKSIISLNAYL